MKPNVIEKIERFCLNREEIEDLIKSGFLQGHFLGGKPGTAQSVDFSLDIGRNATATVVVKTLEQPYEDRQS